ncbi:MAG: PqqD family protein [Clostridia bacterium]|nr:PqqD family protein [Clostridia bacterium]
MKIKQGFMLRKIAENNVVVAVGKATLDFGGLITLNASGAFLWSLMQEEISVDELTKKMCEEYEIDFETANRDIDEFISKLKGAGIIE